LLDFCIKKMLRNKWMVACLLIGFIISVAVISCIPVYTGSILQRMLVKDLEAMQLETETYPGNYSVTLALPHEEGDDLEKSLKTYEKQKALLIDEKIAEQLDVTLVAQSRQYRYLDSYADLVDIAGREKQQRMPLYAKEGIEEHCQIVSGEMPSDQLVDGAIEVMVTEQGYNYYELHLGQEIQLNAYDEGVEPLTLRVVGVYEPKDKSDLYWYHPIRTIKNNVQMNYDLFEELFCETGNFDYAYWYYTFDYTKVNMDKVGNILSDLNGVEKQLGKNGTVSFPAEDVFGEYQIRQRDLNTTLWMLMIPVVLMLVFYIFMVSTLIMEHEKNDITLLKSRGANNWQVLSISLFQTGIIAAVSVVLGTLLGYWSCQFLGLSNGFLEFVNRKNLNLHFSFNSTYVLSVVFILAVGLVAILIPAIQSSRLSIVEYKRKKAKANPSPFWKKFFLDIILLAIAGYGVYNYKSISTVLANENSSMMAHVDPSLFVVNTLMVLGCGMLFLRVFPWIIRLIFRVGKRYWSPELYASMLSVSRSRGREQFIILFLILTISLAMFNATAARTLNTFMVDRTNYAVGTDLILKPVLQATDLYFEVIEDEETGQFTTQQISAADIKKVPEYIHTREYRDIPFQPFQELKGVESATKVYRQEKATLTYGGDETLERVQVMGITPSEFSKVAWMRSDLLPYHINQYLNLMAQDPRAVLVSSELKGKVKEGETIRIGWEGQPDTMECVVYGFIDYWPSYNPNAIDGENKAYQGLVVANYSLIQAQMRLEPYEIWMDLDDTTKHADIYADIEEKGLAVSEIIDRDQQVIQVKNDPMLQGINGTLTLSFVVTLFVSFMGFLIFWILNMKERTLQFGVLRAMGLSKQKLIAMLAFEQLLITGGAVAAGVLIGSVVNQITVPLLEYLYPKEQQVPPFYIYMDVSDYVKIFAVIGLMVVIGLIVLGRIISRIKIDQALKLGEE
jgi:putative ABC transport system permease protein